MSLGPMAVIQLGSILVEGFNQYQQGKAENEMLDQQVEEVTEATYQGINQQLDLLNQQQRQMEEATEERIYQRQVQALKDRSKIMVSAGEANVGGSTVDRLLGQYAMDSAHDQQTHRRNLDNQLQQSAEQGKQAMREGQSRINQVRTQRDQNYNEDLLLNTALKTAPSAISLLKQEGGS